MKGTKRNFLLKKLPYYEGKTILQSPYLVNTFPQVATTKEDSKTLVRSGSHPRFYLFFTQFFFFIKWLKFGCRVEFLVVPFPPCGLLLLGCLLPWTFVLTSCFFSLLCLGAFFFKVKCAKRKKWTWPKKKKPQAFSIP